MFCNNSKALQELIRINVESSRLLRQSEKYVCDDELARGLRGTAGQREENALVLQSFVGCGNASHGRLAADGRLTPGCSSELPYSELHANPRLVLRELLRAEQQIRNCYLRALRDTRGSHVVATLQFQYEQVIKAGDRMRYLAEEVPVSTH
ncbi:MAG: hypothetical protein NXI32_26470 [bacterium]|nr:hypothetical protein [bacterium]